MKTLHILLLLSVSSFVITFKVNASAVITWGIQSNGGDSSAVDISSGVSAISSTESAFAALKTDGSVVTWGNSDNGGDSSSVSGDLSSGVTELFSNKSVFAALKADGSVLLGEIQILAAIQATYPMTYQVM